MTSVQWTRVAAFIGGSAIVLFVETESPVTQANDRGAAQDALAEAEALQAAARYKDAILPAERYLSILEKVRGIGHPDVAEARVRVSEICMAAGDLSCAESLLGQGFDVYQRTLGPEETRMMRGVLTGRAFLLKDQREPSNYGLISFLLFHSEPKDSVERARYLKAIEAYLAVLQPMYELERHRQRSQLNVTLNPLTRMVDMPDAAWDTATRTGIAERLLEVYDYARAKALLDDIDESVKWSGPYLVSVFPAAGGTRRPRLLLDMSHVSPELVWDWTRSFCWLAAQERSWSAVALERLTLNLRNVIAVAANNASEIVRLVAPGEPPDR